MKVLKIVDNIVYLLFSLFAVPMLIYAAFTLAKDEDVKFKNTPLNTTIKSIEEEWGKPDREFSGDRTVYYYNDFIGWGQYVFIFEKGVLTYKTIDD